MVLFLSSAFLMYALMWALFFIPVVTGLFLFDVVVNLIKKIVK